MHAEGDGTDWCGEVTAGSGSGLRTGAGFAIKTHAGSSHHSYVASGLGVPTTASASDLRPMIRLRAAGTLFASKYCCGIQINGTHMSL